jgi:hypothetical protein
MNGVGITNMHVRSLVMVGALLFPSTAAPQNSPTLLSCQSNAKAWRDYSFIEKQWQGHGIEAFGYATPRRPVEAFPLRAKIFSALHTSRPIVRSITPAQGGASEDAVEFEGRVILRSTDEVFVTWSNDINKTWLAAIDLRNKRVIVTHVFSGVTSVGGQMETLDCK